jgi:hypothetical protein
LIKEENGLLDHIIRSVDIKFHFRTRIGMCECELSLLNIILLHVDKIRVVKTNSSKDIIRSSVADTRNAEGRDDCSAELRILNSEFVLCFLSFANSRKFCKQKLLHIFSKDACEEISHSVKREPPNRGKHS